MSETELAALRATVQRMRDLADVYLSGDDAYEAIGVEMHQTLDGDEPGPPTRSSS